jgi:hypothetical protein
MATDDQIADNLIPGSPKRSRSYHRAYGKKTYGEIKRLAGSEGAADEKVDRTGGAPAQQGTETQVMKPTSSLTRGLAHVRREWRAGRFAEALHEVSRLLDAWPDNPHLLVLWSDLVQLQDEEPIPSFGEVRLTLERAAALDEESPETWFELASFVDNVQDDPTTAAKYYEKAIDVSKRFLVEALLGQAKALTQLDRKDEALAYVAQASGLQNAQPKSWPNPRVLELLKSLTALAPHE